MLDERGDKLLELRSGRRYDGKPGTPEFQTMDFGRYVIVVGSSARGVIDDTSSRVLPTISLIEAPTESNMAELLWRLSLPIMCLLQMLLALPFMWLWDAVMPELFSIKTITWMQAWCLMIMANILFKTNISLKSD